MAKKIIAIIPARGGSKGIPHKNFRDVCGKPLFYYQVNNALQSKLVNKIVLATDDEKIKELGRSYFHDKIEIIHRPPEISHDMSKTEDTLCYVLEKLEGKNELYDIVVTLEPTNPLNKTEYVNQCIKKIIDEDFDSSCCVVEDYGFMMNNEEEITAVKNRPMKQHIKPKVRETGNCWATKVSALKTEKNRLAGSIGLVKIPHIDSMHMDYEEDWVVIDALMRYREKDKASYFKKVKKDNISYEEKYWDKSVDPDGVVRDRKTEREKRIRECREEINYINKLNPGKVLDVGCGLGFFLSAINNDWEKYGVEISELASENAKQYGKIFCGNIKDAAYQDNYFDVIVLYHVIEHVENPSDLLTEVRRILKPYGKLVVGSPDFECGAARLYGENFRLLKDNTHISLFGLKGLYEILKDHMFTVEDITFPYFYTEHFTQENLLRLFDQSKVSPPFYGNVMTLYCYKK